MAKIEMVKMENGKFVVTYESGRTRTYQEAPKTVLEWLEASPAPVEASTQMEAEEEPVIEKARAVEPEASTGGDVPENVEEERTSPVIIVETVLPPKGELVPVAASRSILDRILSLWDGFTATTETIWEMYLCPVLTLLLSLLGAAWMAARAGGRLLLVALILARAGAGKALPVAKAFLIQAWGAAAVLALLGARLALLLSETAMAGWKMRQELINEWEAA